MCTVYEYDCRYADDETNGPTDIALHDPPPAKRLSLDSGSSPARRATGATAAAPGIFDEKKHRYVGASAAMAFPHILGAALGSDDPLKMHSFAYNFGVRPEEAANSHGLLGRLISEDDLASLSAVYFSALAPIGDLIDPKIYAHRCRDYYHSYNSTMVAFGAVVAGVAALGSFLSPDRHPRESDLVQYAKAILDDPASMRKLTVDQIMAWGLRVLYLRATTRPNNAWIASCTSMHLCEAIGLHEEENIKKMASVAGAAALGRDADRLRRIFWICWAGHNLLSYESGYSSVTFQTVTCQAIPPTPGSLADQFVQIAQIIPAPDSPFRFESQPQTPREELFERLRALQKLPFTHPFLVVTKADLAFCFYRRIYQLKEGISTDIIQLIIDSGNAALEAAKQLASQGRLFWNVIGSVFQYACVLLALDNPAASVHIAAAFKGLEDLVKAADTGLTRQALSMARYLLGLDVARKKRELERLEAVEMSQLSAESQPQLGFTADTAVPDMDWLADWDEFLIEPYLSVLGP